MEHPLVKMEGIVKNFAGVHALKECEFELRSGEVHALVGENGAGKSTMMKVLTGVYQKDQGSTFYKGKKVDITDTATAQKLGISMIHQELNLSQDLTVAQNIFIGREPRKAIRLFLDDKEMNRKTELLLKQMNLDISPTMKVSELTVAKQQMVEIIKAMSYESQVLIMDEPTAALSDSEIDDLFRMIEQLKLKGVGIVYISHRMAELKRITDRITVMRDGVYINTMQTADVSIDRIIAMMVGREIYQPAKSERNTGGKSETVLQVKGLMRRNTLQDISFSLQKGEILGIAGLIGAGRTELARAIFGADQIDAGEIFIHDQKVKITGPHQAVKHGIGYLSEDRKHLGCLLDMDVKTNVVLATMNDFTKGLGWINNNRISETSIKIVEELTVKTPSIGQKLKFLSGGNQQKVILGKWLTRDCDILIFDEPTRGIDIGAKSEIYKLLESLVAQGKSIIMISSELPEILRISHRIIVMCEGRITGEFNNDDDITQEQIMACATNRTSSAKTEREE
ncbi:sugar ABC transporter ATP-binding protein [Paenibacillus macquariensis]|uniref:Monosaccharide ABC transporter ATP-binding protein, CUT2 family n=1 Tax=Paenibacillus macquariensis TaxID=948756 RepID=A0ABY1KEM6_9BACL|nr:sugar ABC transporter ATP-binding protein [Paenibacillus macquariensis]MEC0093889.1 sugar ABC transporter ATP-binding protein [Paenibacillus macquariensis]OAB33050.1 D-xylose ABC transporter ATP-binding protein [Paenibacillus macquariensis subsp. macquariensis]SIR59160.1 monosaccharide ABC transporter ATP-binding protein, CUT2 family [Paenibacillus macquariensis]